MSRRHKDDDGEARMANVIAGVFGLTDRDVAFLPPATQVGWMESGQVGGGVRSCLSCAPTQPTTAHVPVYDISYYATLPCVVCGRRLDSPLV